MLRDFVQVRHGRKMTYLAIFGAFLLSGFLSVVLGDTVFVATASLLAFLVSETIDTEIFSRAKLSFTGRVLVSGIVGGILDSGIFVVAGMSPLTSGVLAWGQVPFAIIGQMVTKAVVQVLVVIILRRFFKK